MTNEEIMDIVDCYADMIKRICFTYMKNDYEADDIFQTVFLKMIQSDIVFENENHRKAWLIRVTINCCKDTLKSFFRKNIVPIEAYKEDYYETSDYSWVKDALMEIPAKYRIVLYLYYYEQYQVKEIAEILGCGQNTVSTQLKRGKEQMKIKIGEKWNE